MNPRCFWCDTIIPESSALIELPGGRIKCVPCQQFENRNPND